MDQSYINKSNTAKDAFYFSHDSNARNDVKIVKLRRELGAEGYGFYWMLIEVLRDQQGHKLALSAIPDLAFEFHTTLEKLSAIVNGYDLFKSEENLFFSVRLLRSMEEFNRRKAKYIEAGRLGGQASVKHRLGIAQPLKEKEKEKEKENRTRKKFTPPTLQEVEKYFADGGYSTESAQKAFRYYAEANWIDSKGKPVKNWKQKMLGVWFKPEHMIFKNKHLNAC